MWVDGEKRGGAGLRLPPPPPDTSTAEHVLLSFSSSLSRSLFLRMCVALMARLPLRSLFLPPSSRLPFPSGFASHLPPTNNRLSCSKGVCGGRPVRTAAGAANPLSRSSLPASPRRPPGSSRAVHGDSNLPCSCLRCVGDAAPSCVCVCVCHVGLALIVTFFVVFVIIFLVHLRIVVFFFTHPCHRCHACSCACACVCLLVFVCLCTRVPFCRPSLGSCVVCCCSFGSLLFMLFTWTACFVAHARTRVGSPPLPSPLSRCRWFVYLSCNCCIHTYTHLASTRERRVVGGGSAKTEGRSGHG